MKYIGQFIQHFDCTFRKNVIVEGGLTFDSVSLTGIQTSAESFSNDDISLMTSAAVEDKILSYGYTTNTGTLTFNLGGVNNYMVTASSSSTIQGEQYIQAFTASNVTRMNLFSSEDTGDVLQIAVTTHGATSFTTTDDDGAAAHFEIDADGDITLDASGDIALEASTTVTGDLTVNGDNATFQSANADDPIVTIKNTSNAANDMASLNFVKDRDGGTAAIGDNLGEIYFSGEDASGNTQEYGRILSEIDVATHGQESGRLKFGVANHDGGNGYGLILQGGSANDEVDVTVGLGTASVTTIAGSLRPTGQIHIKQGSFTVDAGTDRVYFPMAGSTENIASVGITIPFLAPVGGKLLKLHWRTNQDHSGQTTTFALLNWDSNEAFTTGNATDLGTKAVTPANQNNVTTVDFQSSLTSGTNAFTAGETLAISMQNSSAINSGSNTKYWFTAVFEFDFSSY